MQHGYTPELIAELKGHLKAVTSVDWKRMGDGKDYLVSCSDDDFVRIYDPADDKYELLYTLDTHFITDWHTLTYLALEEVSYEQLKQI